MSGGNWPEREVFQSTDGADGYLYFRIKSRLLPDHKILRLLSTLILGTFSLTVNAPFQLSSIHYTSGSPHKNTGSLMNAVEGVVEMSMV